MSKDLEFKGTTGSWEVQSHLNLHRIVIGNDKESIAFTSGRVGNYERNKEKSIANAQLIAAAPDMLEALKESTETIQWLVDNCSVGPNLSETFYNMSYNTLGRNKDVVNKALGIKE